ncbi:MAG: hypothetical protein ACYDAO_04265 [Thermoplasmataceae archaeon]
MIKTNSLTFIIKSSGSACGCPSGDVCPSADGSCPSGYQLDPNNINCCMPVCPPQSCPSGQYWDTTTCSCQDIIPQSISAEPLVNIDVTWNNSVNCPNTLQNNDIFSNQLGPVRFTVLDAGGKPVPNLPMSFSLSGTKFPFNIADFTGYFLVDTSYKAFTDSNGNFDVYFLLECVFETITSSGDCNILNPHNLVITSTDTVLTMTASVADVSKYGNITGTTSISISQTFKVVFNYSFGL